MGGDDDPCIYVVQSMRRKYRAQDIVDDEIGIDTNNQ